MRHPTPPVYEIARFVSLSDKMQKAHKEIGNLDSYAYFNEIDTKARKLRKKAYTLAQERQMMLDVIRDIYYKEYKNKRLQ